MEDSFIELLEFRVQSVVSKNVRQFVSRSGFTVAELSEKAHLSTATINRLKAGQNISIQGLCALADAIGCDPLSFFKED